MSYHLDVKTTTFVDRHTEIFRFAETLLDAAQKPIRILQVGPGMALRGVGRFNTFEGARIVKRLETALRRIPLPVQFYENFETGELLRMFASHDPRLTVADISRKSLDVVENCYGERIDGTVWMDLSDPAFAERDDLKDRFDIVICLAAVVRVPRDGQAAARHNLASFAKPDGLIISEQDLSDKGYTFLPDSRHISRGIPGG